MSIAAENFSFLLCSERSGSNLITRMAGAHPEISAPSPVHLFRLFAANLHRYGDISRDAEWRTLVGDVVQLFDAKSGRWRTQFEAGMLARDVTTRSLAALLTAMYTAEAGAIGRTRVFVKENQVYDFAGFLENAFPGVRYIYLARDPRDMALSWKKTKAKRGGVVRAARTWREDQLGFLRMAAWLGPKRVVQLRYETLVSEPRPSLERLCDFLGLPFAPEMLDFHRDDVVRDDAANVADWSNIGKPVMANNFGKYAEGLTTDELTFIEGLCFDEMQSLGYRAERCSARTDVSDLARSLEAREPVEKEGYKSVREDERKRRALWGEIHGRIISRTPATLAS